MSKLILPSVQELEQRWQAEIATFCREFHCDYQSPSSVYYENSNGTVTVVARFEQSPKLYLNGEVINLPNYGEDLEEVVRVNWGYIRNKLPRPQPTEDKLTNLVLNYLNLPNDMEEEEADNWLRNQLAAVA